MSKSTSALIAAIDTKLAAIEADKAAAFAKIEERLAEKVTKLQAERAELQAKADTELDTARIEQGTEVKFSYGRAETKKELTGTVLGRKTQASGNDLIKITVGTGFDAQVVTVYVSAVTAIGPFEAA